MINTPKALVLYGDGINCQFETSFALELAGFAVQNIHVFELLENPDQLKDVQMLALPGGFSFGDEIASGKVLAVKIRHRMQSILQQYIEHGRLLLGICNGFQVLVQLGLLPVSQNIDTKLVSLTKNSHGKFMNRWASMDVSQSAASESFFYGLTQMELPVRHGEGNLQLESEKRNTAFNEANFNNTAAIVKQAGALRYTEDINGSFDRIAALTNEKGTVLGLMPHPEAFVRVTQHPNWTNKNWRLAHFENEKEPACGLRLMQNAYNYIQRAV